MDYDSDEYSDCFKNHSKDFLSDKPSGCDLGDEKFIQELKEEMEMYEKIESVKEAYASLAAEKQKLKLSYCTFVDQHSPITSKVKRPKETEESKKKRCLAEIQTASRVKRYDDTEINFLTMLISVGLGPVPLEFDAFRGIKLPYSDVRPTSYAHILATNEWTYNCEFYTPRAINYAGVEQLTSSILSNFSYISATGQKKIINGNGSSVCTGIREKKNGTPYHVVEFSSPGDVIYMNFGLTVEKSIYDGVGVFERVSTDQEVDWEIVGGVGVPNPYFTYDSYDYQTVQEGLILLINGLEYKIKWVNTYNVKKNNNTGKVVVGMGYRGTQVGIFTLPTISQENIFEVTSGGDFYAWRPDRAYPDNESVIKSIKLSPHMASLPAVPIVGRAPIMSYLPIMVGPKTAVELLDRGVEMTFNMFKQDDSLGDLTCRKLIEIVLREMGNEFSCDFECVKNEILKYEICVPVSFVHQILSAYNFKIRSHRITRTFANNQNSYLDEFVISRLMKTILVSDKCDRKHKKVLECSYPFRGESFSNNVIFLGLYLLNKNTAKILVSDGLFGEYFMCRDFNDLVLGVERLCNYYFDEVRYDPVSKVVKIRNGNEEIVCGIENVGSQMFSRANLIKLIITTEQIDLIRFKKPFYECESYDLDYDIHRSALNYFTFLDDDWYEYLFQDNS